MTANAIIESPNFTQVPNDVFDKFLPLLNGGAAKTLMFICRKTYGFHKKSDCLSISQICKGTGLSKPTALKSLDTLSSMKLIFSVLLGPQGRQERFVLLNNNENVSVLKEFHDGELTEREFFLACGRYKKARKKVAKGGVKKFDPPGKKTLPPRVKKFDPQNKVLNKDLNKTSLSKASVSIQGSNTSQKKEREMDDNLQKKSFINSETVDKLMGNPTPKPVDPESLSDKQLTQLSILPDEREKFNSEEKEREHQEQKAEGISLSGVMKNAPEQVQEAVGQLVGRRSVRPQETKAELAARRVKRMKELDKQMRLVELAEKNGVPIPKAEAKRVQSEPTKSSQAFGKKEFENLSPEDKVKKIMERISGKSPELIAKNNELAEKRLKETEWANERDQIEKARKLKQHKDAIASFLTRPVDELVKDLYEKYVPNPNPQMEATKLEKFISWLKKESQQVKTKVIEALLENGEKPERQKARTLTYIINGLKSNGVQVCL